MRHSAELVFTSLLAIVLTAPAVANDCTQQQAGPAQDLAITLEQAAGQLPEIPEAATARFEQTARGLLACYEKTGRLDRSYDEEGDCEGLQSIWLKQSDNPTMRVSVLEYEHEGNYQHAFGDTMHGFVYWDRVGPNGQIIHCFMEIRFIATDEDAHVTVVNGPICEIPDTPGQAIASQDQAP